MKIWIWMCAYRVGLKFSFNESDSKFPKRHVWRTFSANWKFCLSSESLRIEFDWHSLMSTFPSPGLELSSVGCGAHAEQTSKTNEYYDTIYTVHKNDLRVCRYLRRLPVERVLRRPPQQCPALTRDVSSRASVKSCENCSILTFYLVRLDYSKGKRLKCFIYVALTCASNCSLIFSFFCFLQFVKSANDKHPILVYITILSVSFCCCCCCFHSTE